MEAASASPAAADRPGPAPGGQQAQQAQQGWEAAHEAECALEPADDSAWLQYALAHLGLSSGAGSGDWGGGGARGEGALLLLPPDPTACSAALKVVKRGIERNRQSPLLWPTYLHLYVSRPGLQAEGGLGRGCGMWRRLCVRGGGLWGSVYPYPFSFPPLTLTLTVP
jgi:hypothetical protein